jgi:hypothetical protein
MIKVSKCLFIMFIPDPIFYIPIPDSRIQGCQDPGYRIRIRKNASILNLKTDTNFSKIRSGMLIPEPGPGFFPIPDPGSRGKNSTGSRIPDTQDCRLLTFSITLLPLNQRQTLTVNRCLPFFPIGRFGAVQSADFLRGTCIK